MNLGEISMGLRLLLEQPAAALGLLWVSSLPALTLRDSVYLIRGRSDFPVFDLKWITLL